MDIINSFDIYVDVSNLDVIFATEVGNTEKRSKLSRDIKVKGKWPISNCLPTDYLILCRFGFVTVDRFFFTSRYKQLGT